MKKLLSAISFTILLFVPIQLSCSGLNDFENTTPKPPKKLVHQAEQSTAHQSKFQPQSSSIFSSPQAQFAAEVTTTVVTTLAKGTYDVSVWAVKKTMDAYKQRNQNSQSFEPNNNNSDCEANSDSDSGSDSGSEFCKVKTEKKTPKRKSFFRDQHELQESLQKDTGKTLNKLTEVVKDYFKKQDPDDLVTQKDMRHTFTLLQESCEGSKNLYLPQVIADDYNMQQRSLLMKIIEDHINNIEPEFEFTHKAAIKKVENDYTRRITIAKKKRDRAMHKADETYLCSLNKSKNTIHTFAYNSEYLNKRAAAKADHPAHDLSNFENPESYKKFIANMRKLQTETNITEQQDHSISEPAVSTSFHTGNATNNSSITHNVENSTGKNKKKNKTYQEN